MDQEPVYSSHHPVQPAAPEEEGDKGKKTTKKGASVRAGKVKERQGERGEGRKEREGGRKEAGA